MCEQKISTIHRSMELHGFVFATTLSRKNSYSAHAKKTKNNVILESTDEAMRSKVLFFWEGK